MERVYAILRYCAYGPQITNEWDERYMMNLKREIWNEETVLEFSNQSSGLLSNLRELANIVEEEFAIRQLYKDYCHRRCTYTSDK